MLTQGAGTLQTTDFTGQTGKETKKLGAALSS